MRSLTNAEKSGFLTFNDGIAKFYKVQNIAEKGDKPVEKPIFAVSLRFEYETVGISRFYTAMQANVKIDNLIRTPIFRDLSTQDIVLVNGVKYKILQIQHVEETKPPISRFSLQKVVEKYDLEKFS